ncbi:MAG: discoidin domain-containing protein [Verrucomicrobiota bacterium]
MLSALILASSASAQSVAGSWTKERWASVTWQQITGGTVANPFITPPESVTLTGSTTSDASLNYIDRVRGTVRAPVAGLYTFWLTGDDVARLALSADATKWNARGIAEVTSWLAPGAWDDQWAQRSTSVYLAEGETRFLEVLHQQGGGSSHAGVAWTVQPVSASENLVNWAAAAKGSIASQSSTYGAEYPASKGIDGDPATFPHTGNQPGSWLLVDFRQNRAVSRVELVNRNDSGNFWKRLSNFRVTVEDARGAAVASKDFYKGSGHAGVSEMWELAAPVAARRIRVQLLGLNRDGNHYLHPAEVRAWGPELEIKNWTREPGATAALSSTYGNLAASHSFDGNYDTYSHTNGEAGSYLLADFGTDRPVDSVEIFNRWQDNVMNRLSNFRVSILDSAGAVVAVRDVPGPVKAAWRWDLDATVTGRKVKVEIPTTNLAGNSYLNIAELNVWGGENAAHRAIRETIPASAMASYDPAADDDADDDWMRDSIEAGFGLDSNDPADAYGDLDGDGFWNAFELQKGNDPAHRDSIAGVLLEERWDGIPGIKLRDAAYRAPFIRPADSVAIISSAESYATGLDYVTRARGWLTAPVSGEYTFWTGGDTDVDFWLSSSDSKFERRRIVDSQVSGGPSHYDMDISQKSRPITLAAGQKYYFELWHKEDFNGTSYWSVAWKKPGGSRELIPPSCFASYPGDANDRDDDDLKDDYELANGLDPTSAEGVNGTYGDLDGEGLDNFSEMQHGTKANAVDSNSNGTSDFDEANFFNSTTLANDVGAFVPVATLPGDSYTSAFGEFVKANGTARQSGRRGSVTYPVTISAAGIHALKFTISSIADGTRSEDYEFDVKLDGKRIGYKTIHIAADGTGTLALLTPWLDAGRTHEIEIFIDNSYNWRRVSIDQLQVLKAGGTDSNANGTPDWVEIRLNDTNGFDKAVQYSKTSPAQVEGRVKHFDFLNANGADVKKAPDGRFFSFVPLEPGVPKNLAFTFENGGNTAATTIQWLPTNLLTENSLTIVEGDSLLLTAFENAENAGAENYIITANGQTITNTAAQPAAVAFTTPGITTIELIHTAADGATQTTRSITANVLPKINIEAPLCIVGYPRQWTHPALPNGASLQIDSNVTKWQETTGNTWMIGTHTPVNQPLLVRGGTNGLILDSSEVRSASVRTSDLTGSFALEEYQGGLIVATPVVVFGDKGNIEITFNILISGVIFDNGATSKILELNEFDAHGQYLLIMRKSNFSHSNCHNVVVKQSNTVIANVN